MTDKEVLEKALERAIENGLDESNNFGWQLETLKVSPKIRNNGSCGTRDDNEFHINEVVFHHDFAKAFWPSISCHHKGEAYRHSPPCKKGQWGWEYHLQQMVLEENPINYLKQFI